MKNIISTLLFLAPILTFSQYAKIATHYDAKKTAIQIVKGNIASHLSESVDFTIEKKNGKFKTTEDRSPEWVEAKIKKCFKRGRAEFISRTNGGYTFTIAVINPKDDTKIFNYCTFSVDAFTQKIKDVEINRGE